MARLIPEAIHSFGRNGKRYELYNRTLEDLIKFCKEGRLHDALDIGENLQQQGVFITRDDAYCLLEECEKQKDLECGRRVQSLMAESKLESIPVLGDHLIRIFASHGCLLEADQVFKRVAKPSIYTWAAIISAHAKLCQGETAIGYYYRMRFFDIEMNNYVYVAVLKACTTTKALFEGRIIHKHVIESGLESDVFVGSILVDMYAKCGSLEEACIAFDKLSSSDVVIWSAVIAADAQYGAGYLALESLDKMQMQGIKANDVTFLGSLKACATLGTIQQGRLVNEQIIERGLQYDIVVGSTLIDMYAKCGNLEEAQTVFDKLPNRNIVAWNAILAGYAQHGEGLIALDCFEQMQEEGIYPSKATYLSILKACWSIRSIAHGRLYHEMMIKDGLLSEIMVGSTLVDMYAKCGSLREARNEFNKMPCHNIVTWNAMGAGYAHHGEGFMAMQCFEEMQEEGIKPDEVSFTNVLIAFSRAGLLDEGRWFFNSMREYYHVPQSISHCHCMVDLLGRTGCLFEAENLLWNTVPSNILGWSTLLSACRMHGNVEIARHCFDEIVFLDANCAAGYMLMLNIYLDAHMQEEAYNIQKLAEHAGIWDMPMLA